MSGGVTNPRLCGKTREDDLYVLRGNLSASSQDVNGRELLRGHRDIERRTRFGEAQDTSNWINHG
jgi:hypothetical protein